MTDKDEPRSEPGHATPEGYTSEKPAPSELGKPGTPGAAADADHDSAASVADHDSQTDMDAHTSLSDDDHGHAEPRLGPIDWGAWAYALVGAAAALVVVALFWVAIS
ncbi:MAG: hypothetical protein WD830_03255 [Chloroflexota bacterium]